jgi:hypothetical protein
VTLEPEAPIDLLSDDPKRAARCKPEPCEQLVEESFKPKAPGLRIKLGDLDQKSRKFLRLRLVQRRRRLGEGSSVFGCPKLLRKPGSSNSGILN